MRPAGEGEGEGEGDADNCALSPLARELLEQTVNELFTAAAFATTNTHGGGATDFAYGVDLVGLDVGVLQIATLAFPCTEPTTFDPTCETALGPEPGADPFFDAHDRCFRLGCVAADQPSVDVYFAFADFDDDASEAGSAFNPQTPAMLGARQSSNLVWKKYPDMLDVHLTLQAPCLGAFANGIAIILRATETPSAGATERVS